MSAITLGCTVAFKSDLFALTGLVYQKISHNITPAAWTVHAKVRSTDACCCCQIAVLQSAASTELEINQSGCSFFSPQLPWVPTAALDLCSWITEEANVVFCSLKLFILRCCFQNSGYLSYCSFCMSTNLFDLSSTILYHSHSYHLGTFCSFTNPNDHRTVKVTEIPFPIFVCLMWTLNTFSVQF